jgi:hypothetical protein
LIFQRAANVKHQSQHRRSELYGAILSPSSKVGHGRRSNGNPYSRSAIAARMKGEPYRRSGT